MTSTPTAGEPRERERAIDDPATLARGARIVRVALERRRAARAAPGTKAGGRAVA
ncbi:hypothetical protein [Amycolatopsis sp. CA-126428]|uniref:hypothetical protein n=1 Tax=Amycolatopsis sp. CA-126428 TaxID=2073158 RepID=UPI001304AD51|nr:hypothetical protein [Amycolatopsis sp. CA-126428]